MVEVTVNELLVQTEVPVTASPSSMDCEMCNKYELEMEIWTMRLAIRLFVNDCKDNLLWYLKTLRVCYKYIYKVVDNMNIGIMYRIINHEYLMYFKYP